MKRYAITKIGRLFDGVGADLRHFPDPLDHQACQFDSLVRCFVLNDDDAGLIGFLNGSGLMVNDYAGIQEFDGTVERGVSINNNDLAGDGVLLATVGSDEDPTWGGPVIAEWQAGDISANGRDDVLGGQRVVLLTGSREHSGLTAEGSGIYDLTEDGAKILLNAVTYMTGKEGGDPIQEPVEASIALARDDKGISITFTGTLQSADSVDGPWSDEAGSSSPMTVDATGGMKFYRAVP